MKPSKEDMLKSLPIRQGDITIRSWTREDTYERANWSSYPAPYADFNFALRGASKKELDRHFLDRDSDPERLPLAVDHITQAVIGYFALHEINWSERSIGNVGLRIHPEWCDKGIGTSVLAGIAKWCRECGMRTLRLDVSAANQRAVRCYEKAGLVKVGQFWRDNPKLQDIDILKEQHDQLRPHFRAIDGIPQIRFWWMQLNLGKTAKQG